MFLEPTIGQMSMCFLIILLFIEFPRSVNKFSYLSAIFWFIITINGSRKKYYSWRPTYWNLTTVFFCFIVIVHLQLLSDRMYSKLWSLGSTGPSPLIMRMLLLPVKRQWYQQTYFVTSQHIFLLITKFYIFFSTS